MTTFGVSPIGVVRSPFREKVQAPRQPAAARDVAGTVEIFPEYEHALSDLDGIERVWILYWFHLNDGHWRPKVLPPRSDRRRGVFATRSPHRPNPIGLSCVRLERVDGLVLHVRDVDMIDGTPVLDVKPYLAYADAFPDARAGWLEPADPIEAYSITWTDEARARASFLAGLGLDLVAPAEQVLALGPQPHPYRRIRRDGDALVLAVKEWRLRFRVDGRVIEVVSITTGYRPSQIFAAAPDPSLGPSIALHRAFVERFGG